MALYWYQNQVIDLRNLWLQFCRSLRRVAIQVHLRFRNFHLVWCRDWYPFKVDSMKHAIFRDATKVIGKAKDSQRKLQANKYTALRLLAN